MKPWGSEKVATQKKKKIFKTIVEKYKISRLKNIKHQLLATESTFSEFRNQKILETKEL